MTREEAYEFITQSIKTDVDMAKIADAINILEQEPTTKIEESNFSQEQYLADIQSAYDCGKSVLGKIKAEIEPTRKMYLEMNDIDWLNGCDYVLSVIEKYKTESEDKE